MQVAALTSSLRDAGERADARESELDRLESDLGESCQRLGAAEETLRLSQGR